MNHPISGRSGFDILFLSLSGNFPTLLHLCNEQHADQVTTQQCFAVTDMSLRFSKGTELCRVFVCRSSLLSTDLAGELGSPSRLLSVVSTRAEIVACSGCPAALARTIDNSEFSTCGVQSCFRFESLSLPRLMHKLSYSVFGHKDFVSVLQALMVSLGSSLTEDWVLRSPELSIVSNTLGNLNRVLGKQVACEGMRSHRIRYISLI